MVQDTGYPRSSPTDIDKMGCWARWFAGPMAPPPHPLYMNVTHISDCLQALLCWMCFAHSSSIYVYPLRDP